MSNIFERTERLIGQEAVASLKEKTVAVFGIGGVGGYVVEGLVRAGVGHLHLYDKDEVDITNINRQIIATMDTVGEPKVEVAKKRALSICPEIEVTCHQTFYLPEVADQYDFRQYDYVVDAVDTITAKLELIVRAEKANVPVISCMGTGNKLDPTRFEVADIYETSVCPLAKVMRRELKRRGISHCKVVYSREEVKTPISYDTKEGEKPRKIAPASISFVPSVAGLIIAGEVVKDLIGE